MSFDPPLIWFLVGLGLVLMEFMIPGAITVDPKSNPAQSPEQPHSGVVALT